MVPLVSVCVLTFNHAQYIEQCLHSILSQKTSFAFEILVRDDASTDGTQSVLKRYQQEYPTTIRLVLEPKNTWSNPDCKPVIGRILAPLARGRYLASCEGDDYWTDDTKLQRQFDYMEAHPKCNLCSHATTIVRDEETSSSMRLTFGNEDRDISCDEIMRCWAMSQDYGISSIHPSSCFSRREAELSYANDWQIGTTAGDYVRACYMAHSALIHFMSRPMSAYRYLSSRSWTANAESDTGVLASHYEEFIVTTHTIDRLTRFEHHDSAMRGCIQRALLLAGMTSGREFFTSEIGAPIKPYLSGFDHATLAALRILNAFGLRPARNAFTGGVTVKRKS